MRASLRQRMKNRICGSLVFNAFSWIFPFPVMDMDGERKSAGGIISAMNILLKSEIRLNYGFLG